MSQGGRNELYSTRISIIDTLVSPKIEENAKFWHKHYTPDKFWFVKMYLLLTLATPYAHYTWISAVPTGCVQYTIVVPCSSGVLWPGVATVGTHYCLTSP